MSHFAEAGVRPTSFLIDDILVNKPKQFLREYQALSAFARPSLPPDYAYAYLPNPAFLNHHGIPAQAFLHHKQADTPFLIPATGEISSTTYTTICLFLFRTRITHDTCLPSVTRLLLLQRGHSPCIHFPDYPGEKWYDVPWVTLQWFYGACEEIHSLWF